MNMTILMGNLVTEPELQNLSNSGRALGKFRVAVKRTVKDSKGNYPTDFFNVQAWGNLAEMISEKVTKGNRVLIQGSIYNNEYTKDGVKVYAPVINAEKITVIDWANDNKSTSNNDFSAVQQQNNGNFMW